MRLGAVCPGDERCLLCFMHVASIFPVIALLIYLFFRSKITRKKLLKKKKRSFFAIQYASPPFGCDAEVDQKNMTKIKHTHLCTSGSGVFATM